VLSSTNLRLIDVRRCQRLMVFALRYHLSPLSLIYSHPLAPIHSSSKQLSIIASIMQPESTTTASPDQITPDITPLTMQIVVRRDLLDVRISIEGHS